MKSKDISLGDLQLEVLKVIWEHQPCTVLEVAEILAERKGLARTTVLTVMQKLHAKGLLSRRKVDGIFQYSPTEGRREVLSRLIGQFLDKVLDGSPAPFMAYLAETEELDDEQMAALRRIAEELTDKEGGGDERDSRDGQ